MVSSILVDLKLVMYLVYHCACLFLVQVDRLSESVIRCEIRPLSLACTDDLRFF